MGIAVKFPGSNGIFVSDYTPISHQLISHEEALAQHEARSKEIMKFFNDILDKYGKKWLEEYIRDQIWIAWGFIPFPRSMPEQKP